MILRIPIIQILGWAFNETKEKPSKFFLSVFLKIIIYRIIKFEKKTYKNIAVLKLRKKCKEKKLIIL